MAMSVSTNLAPANSVLLNRSNKTANPPHIFPKLPPNRNFSLSFLTHKTLNLAPSHNRITVSAISNSAGKFPLQYHAHIYVYICIVLCEFLCLYEKYKIITVSFVVLEV